MVANPFIPTQLVGRQAELQQISQILATDGDLLLAGIPGSGRRTLIRYAAQQVEARLLDVDCLRATDSRRFLQLLAEAMMTAFDTPEELRLIQRWSLKQPIVLEQPLGGRARLVWPLSTTDPWPIFTALLALPQVMAEALNCRVVVVLQNVPHLRSWDRSEQWLTYLCQEFQHQSRGSYVLIATVAEGWANQANLSIVLLPPLQPAELTPWLVECMAHQGLQFEAESQALNLLLDYVQGNLGDAIALARRIWLDHYASEAMQGCPNRPLAPAKQPLPENDLSLIQAHHVHRSALSLIEDLALTFESLILLLPPSQVRVLESLALDPTDSPHAREYIQRHQLSRGGGLQGALASLQQKGLVYGPENGYRITMPMLALWLKHRLT